MKKKIKKGTVRALIEGMKSITTIHRSSCNFARRDDDAKNIASDWRAVGNDIRWSMKHFKPY